MRGERETSAYFRVTTPRLALTADSKMQDDVFRKAMAGVKPLKNRPATVQPPTPPTPGQLRRREAAVSRDLEPDPNSLPAGEAPQLAPDETTEFKKDGVQPRVMRKLKRGQFPIEGYLDLHHHTVRQARDSVHRFLAESRDQARRCVAIVHGRGELSETPARLKSHVVHWMREAPGVVAYTNAPARDGGTGVLYVLLGRGGVRDPESRAPSETAPGAPTQTPPRRSGDHD